MKNRIKQHRKVRVADLVPHELNPRVHNDDQREALRAMIEEIGYARSVLAYETRCTSCHGKGFTEQDEDLGGKSRQTCLACHGKKHRLKLIDGHLRQSELDPDDEIDVEVLDVNDEEARKLLLSIDPLAALADYDEKTVNALREVTQTENDTLKALWANLADADRKTKRTLNTTTREKPATAPIENYLVLIECDDETHQLELLKRYKAEGLKCKALTS